MCLTTGQDLTGDEKAGLARVLSLVGDETGRFGPWCEEELARQALKCGLPEAGFDFLEVRFRPLSHILLDILMPLRSPSRMDSL